MLLLLIGVTSVGAQLAHEDRRLNQAYRELMREWRSNPPRRAELRTSERDWIVRRDDVCNAKQKAAAQACLLKMTRERADFLEDQGHL